MRGPLLGLVLLSACGGESPAFYTPPEPWMAESALPHAILSVNGLPTYFLDGDRVIAEARAWSFVTYGYDDRGLLIVEEHEAKAPVHVRYEYDDEDHLTLRDQVTELDGVVASHTRMTYKYGPEGWVKRRSEEVEKDGKWSLGLQTEYEYDEAGRLTEMTTSEPTGRVHDPMKARYLLAFTYDARGRPTDIDRLRYDDDGAITAHQIRNLNWSKEGLLLSSRELDELSAYFYSPEGDLQRVDGMLLRQDRDTPPPQSRVFARSDAPASFWYGPWQVGEGPERLINLFGRY